jgi:hypothetical protein
MDVVRKIQQQPDENQILKEQMTSQNIERSRLSKTFSGQ